MDHQQIIKNILDGMIGIGGVPSNEEFYAELDMRVRAALGIGVIKSVCVDCKDEFEAQTERCDACENNKGFPM